MIEYNKCAKLLIFEDFQEKKRMLFRTFAELILSSGIIILGLLILIGREDSAECCARE